MPKSQRKNICLFFLFCFFIWNIKLRFVLDKINLNKQASYAKFIDKLITYYDLVLCLTSLLHASTKYVCVCARVKDLFGKWCNIRICTSQFFFFTCICSVSYLNSMFVHFLFLINTQSYRLIFQYFSLER